MRVLWQIHIVSICVARQAEDLADRCLAQPASLCIDMQPLYPRHLVPDALRSFLQFYLKLSGDPLMRNFVAGDPSVAWFRSL